ncbi:GNAT family N-acetyltransferase [Rugosimonospora africana]|uniref:Cellulose biosynthesis protein CelD n=1 Tax=Rugosimonospora africana TaxID=556532 RepID=A0A8J3QJ45_9ACTN|nr:GNAT family N-acetyltransferase [Rugosimonospora africana]GIH11883.1 cellulose biosynthesis protein CelD [Rugosimonospora africana]
MTASASIDVRAYEAERSVALFTDGWDELVAANPWATSFQRAWWYRTWVRVVAAAESCTPVVFTAEAGGVRVGCGFGLYATDSGTVARPLGWPWSDYHDAVGPDSPLGVDLVATMLTRLGADHPVELRELRPHGLLARAGRKLGWTAAPDSETVAVNLRDAAHLQRVTGRREYAMKRRRLARLGELRLTQLGDPDDIARLLPAFIEMHRAQWADRADAVAPFDGGVVDEAFHAFGAAGGREGGVLLTVLSHGDEPLAMYFGFRHGRWYGGYRTTYRLDAWRYSPGHLLLQEMLRDFHRAGLAELDLMRGGYAYKLAYASTVTRNTSLTLGSPTCT